MYWFSNNKTIFETNLRLWVWRGKEREGRSEIKARTQFAHFTAKVHILYSFFLDIFSLFLSQILCIMRLLPYVSLEWPTYCFSHLFILLLKYSAQMKYNAQILTNFHWEVIKWTDLKLYLCSFLPLLFIIRSLNTFVGEKYLNDVSSMHTNLFLQNSAES